MKGARMDTGVFSVSYYPMDGMVLSTGNIYLTMHDVLGRTYSGRGRPRFPARK